ncbi:MAG: ATP-binding protein, partial [Gemmatimonadota bacterium]
PDERDDILRRIGLMQPLLNQVAIALEHARLFAQTQSAARAQQVSLAVQQVRNAALQMASEADWSAVVERLREVLAGLVSFAGCGVQLVRPDGSMVGYSAGKGALQAFPFPVAPPPVRRAIDSGQLQYRRNPEEMKRAGDDPGMFLMGARSVIDVPFAGGTLALNSLVEDGFSAEDIAILGQFAAVVSEAHQRFQDLRALAAKERQLQQSQKMEAVGQLTAGVAHNFNNMLQGVVGSLELALLDANAAVVPAIEAALQGTQRAAEVVQQLMAFSRGAQARPRRALNIADVIGDTEAICRRTFDRRIHLSVVRRAAPPVIGDPLLLQQVFLNLCLNARDAVSEYSQSLPSIRVSWQAVEVEAAHAPDYAGPGPYVRVEVADNGRGMDEETQKRIFEPFYTTKPVDRGTGLGLSTAFGIVRDHGGWIECESQPGSGARFAVYLPVSSPGGLPADPIQPAGASGGSDTILVVDDEDMVRDTARQMLELRGYQVLVAADGEEALEVHRRHRDRIALVLLDHSMPGLSGRQVLERLRERSPRVRVVIFTGFPADAADFAGADDLVRKPFTLDGLVSKVREVLDRPA